MMMYLHTILLPYIEKTCAELQLNCNHRALAIFDQCKAQTTDNVFSTLERNHISALGNCTDCLQPLDLSINKPVKDHLKSCFHKWYAAGIQKKVLTGDDDKRVIDLWLSLLKPFRF